MAVQLTISDGTDTVDLIATGATGFQLLESRRMRYVMDPSMFYQAPSDLEMMMFVERYTMKLKASSHDNSASQLQTFLRLLRDAWRYHVSPTQHKPVYITAQTTNETNVRYALVYRCPEVSGPDFWDYQFDQNDLWTPVTVTIQRFVWQSGIPGVLPSAAALSPVWMQEATFEANTTDEFDSVVTSGSGALASTTGSARNGENGLKVTIAAASDAAYGRFIGLISTDKVLIGEAWFNPNSLTMATNDIFTLILVLSGGGGNVCKVEVTYDGSNYRLRYGVFTDSSAWISGTFVDITNDWHHIRLNCSISMSAGANNGAVELVIDGVSQNSVTNVDNDTYTIGRSYFGAIVGVDAGTSGSFFMDDCRWARGPDSPTIVPVANYLDDIYWKYIYNYDNSAGTFSGNEAGNNSWNLFEVSGSTPAVNDKIYFGGDTTPNAPHVIVLNISTAGVFAADVILQYYNGAWVTLTYGTDYTIYPAGNEDNLFTATGEWAIFINVPAGDLAAVAINGVTTGWYRLVLNAVTTWTTSPAVATVGTNTFTAYAARFPYFDIPEETFNGDVPPLLNLRLYSPDGGDENEGFDNLSRILIGAKRATSGFTSHLNAGIISGVGWTVANLTDTASVAGYSAVPGGTYASVSFSTDATMVSRLRWTGSNILSSYVGEYRVFLRAGQAGGAVGDVQVKLRVLIGDTQTYSPKFETAIVKTASFNTTWEILDLGQIKIPFTPVADQDLTADLYQGELYFELHAERTTGSATLSVSDLILIPIDLWSVELDDPVSDSVNGTSALRGSSLIEMDGGILANRTMKQVRTAGVGNSDWVPAETWSRGGPALTVEPSTEVRLYFLMMNYPVTFGTPPLTSSLGQGLMVELYGLDRWMGLRGAN